MTEKEKFQRAFAQKYVDQGLVLDSLCLINK